MSRFRHIQPDESPPDAPAADDNAYDFGHYYDLAQQSMRRGTYEKALRYYGRALEQDRDRPEAWLGQIEALLSMGQPEEAMTWMEQAAGVIGEVPGLLALRAIAAARSGAIDDARAWSDRALRHGSDDPAVWLSRAEVLYTTNSAEMARVNLRKAHERAPTAYTALRCGEVALFSDDLPGARPWLERATREDVENPVAALRLGVYWERAGDWERAEAEFNRAVALEPHMEAARLALADLKSRGLWSRLTATFRKWSRS